MPVRELTDILFSELIALRAAVFGRDNAYTDELAELAGIDEEPQRETETDDQYADRVKRVTARRKRLDIKEG
jgi:hypothetical protein